MTQALAPRTHTSDQEDDAARFSHGMPKQFSLLSLLSMSFALLATWNGFGSAIGTSLTDASTAGTILSLTVAACMMGVTALGMAELSSSYPFPGAQYYWSYAVSSPAWAPFSSYCSACVSTFGWWLGLGATANFVASMIQSIICLCYEDYVPRPSDTWVLYIVVIWAAVALNIFGSRIVPMFHKFMLYFSLLSLVTTTISLLVLASPNFASRPSIFADKTSRTGWSDGYGMLLCIMNAIYGFLGLDAGAHMSEEIVNPAVNVPKIILYPVLIGFVTTLPFSFTLMFVIRDLDAVLQTSSTMPLVEIYLQATGSKTISATLLASFAFSFFGCACGNITGSSRQIWSASRDHCFPLSKHWGEIHCRWRMPANAACLSGLVASLYGLIFIWSSTAFSSMVGANVIFMTLSYVIPQAILLCRGRSQLPVGPFGLGSYGYLVNGTACIWAILVIVVSCFPTRRPVTLENMNWNSLVVSSILVMIAIGWVYCQKTVFQGPTVDRSKLHRHHEETRPLFGNSQVTHVSWRETSCPTACEARLRDYDHGT